MRATREYAPRLAAALAEFSDEELQTAAAVLGRLGAMFDEIQPGDARDGQLAGVTQTVEVRRPRLASRTPKRSSPGRRPGASAN